AGQVIARLWTAEVGSAVAELRLLSQDPVLRAAAEGRLRALGAPADAGVDGTWNLRAPIGGVVTARLVDAGSFLAPGAALAEVAPDAARLAEFYTLVPPPVGTPVSFSDGVDTFAGTVQGVLPAGNAAGTGVRAMLEAQPAVGRPLLATWDEALPEGLWLPRAAVVDTGARAVVFVVDGATAQPRAVHVAARSESEVMVHGIDAADRVVASGAFWLDADTQVAGGGHAGHGGH
ncbi:MAG: HlyD family efflux transporter periplasmic adaptor subunit, partial [Deltaproteobacteria bacterium]|nr:HlyD family efflux transporter periplasmic adaptor subunit [Deltaproteobacteria bacterium]